MMSDGEKADFGSFIDDNYTEELLEEHEAEAERLRTEVELRGPMLPRVKEWIALKADEEELERSAQDPNRFKKRGSAMLREEKMRKRVEKLKPKVSHTKAELIIDRGRAVTGASGMGGGTRATILGVRRAHHRHNSGCYSCQGSSQGGEEGRSERRQL